MGNFLQTITAGIITSKLKYNEIGSNTELGIVYKSNGDNYQIVSVDSDIKYTIVGDTVKQIVERTNYSEEEIMDLLFIVYNAYDNYKLYLEAQEKVIEEKKYLKKLQENMVDTISRLITKYNYQDVYGYLTEMSDFDLIKLFNGQPASQEYSKLEEDLSSDINKSYNGEPEELVSRYFN